MNRQTTNSDDQVSCLERAEKNGEQRFLAVISGANAEPSAHSLAREHPGQKPAPANAPGSFPS